MKPLVLDLHIHSPFAGGGTKYTTLEAIADTCFYKGIDIVGTGDCLCPQWYERVLTELELNPKNNLYFHPKEKSVHFIFTTEVNCSWQGKKAHILNVFQDAEAVRQTGKFIQHHGAQPHELRLDGRPTINLSPKQLIHEIRSRFISCLIIPAHILTPWSGLMGWQNNIDSIWDVFDESEPPDALETGLSADIDMIKQVAAHTDKISVKEYVDGLKEERTEKYQALLNESNCTQVPNRFIIKTGIPFEVLCRTSEEEKVDMVVMGTKGRSNIAGILFGSQAEKMFRHCPVPLLSIREGDFMK